MHDCFQLEKRGIPSVAISHDIFAVAARAHAKMLGLPDMPLAIMPRPQAGWDEATIQRVVDDLLGPVERGLVERGE